MGSANKYVMWDNPLYMALVLNWKNLISFDFFLNFNSFDIHTLIDITQKWLTIKLKFSSITREKNPRYLQTSSKSLLKRKHLFLL